MSESLFAAQDELAALPSARLVELKAQASRQWRAAERRLEELNRRKLPGASDSELIVHRDTEKQAELELRRANDQVAALDRALQVARRREAAQAGERDAASAFDDVGRLLEAAQLADAAATTARMALHMCVNRLFDKEVRSHLTSDPTAGRRAEILRLCPNLNRLADLAEHGHSLALPKERWPKLVLGPEGAAHFEHLDRISGPDDLEEWLSSYGHGLPAGSQAADQLGDLKNKFARRPQPRGAGR